MTHGTKAIGAMLFITLLGCTGCVVPQPRGAGQMSYRTEASTGAGYYLYLPEDYVKTAGQRGPLKKFPLVVSFHGMRPWDSAGAQIVEWQQEADRYGYVVIAPDTRVSDMLGELPIRRVSSSVRADERDTLAVLDEVMHNLDVDPNRVLSTSWSMGGYLAHYMVNRHPDRFSCLAVRQSNFSAEILDPQQVPDYRGTHDIAIFGTQHDFAICRRESKKAIAWYTGHGFDTTHGVIDRLGHERTPETAAAFFAASCGAEPKTPPTNLATRITMGSWGNTKSRKGPVPASARQPQRAQPGRQWQGREDTSSGNTRVSQSDGQRSNGVPHDVAPPKSEPQRSSSGALSDARGTGRQSPRRTTPRTAPRNNATAVPSRPLDMGAIPLATRPLPSNIEPQPAQPADRKARDGRADRDRQHGKASVRLSAYIGISPMRVSYTVQMPPNLLEGAKVLWTDNDKPISEGISGQRSLVEPGQHRIDVKVVAKDGREFHGSKTVTVLDRLSFENDD